MQTSDTLDYLLSIFFALFYVCFNYYSIVFLN